MRKIDENEYVDYTFKDAGFSVTMGKLKPIIELFNNRAHGTITGRKHNGDVSIIDQK